MKPAKWMVAAASALLLAGCQPAAREPAAVTPAPAPDSATVIVEPGAAFAWPGVPRAELYRIELFDDTHQLLGGAVTRDTTVPADAVVPDTASTGSWRVVPVTAGGTELPASATGRFLRR
jgi:hypothetical protein